MSRNLLSLLDLSVEELESLIDQSFKFKKERNEGIGSSLENKSIGLIFLKSSTRTRVSFQVAVSELGGHPMFLDDNALQLGRGESMEDTARVLSRYLHAIVIRGHEHENIKRFAEFADIPVINALTDKYHPCQLLADVMTIKEYRGEIKGAKVAFLGDTACNMANSWIIAASKFGMELRLAGPKEFHADMNLINSLPGKELITYTEDPKEAAKDADFIYTDVWVSMGYEDEAKERLEILKPYQVNQELMDYAAESAKLMHCLPAYRGKEITAEVLDGPQSIIWDEAENRLHVQKAAMALMFT